MVHWNTDLVCMRLSVTLVLGQLAMCASAVRNLLHSVGTVDCNDSAVQSAKVLQHAPKNKLYPKGSTTQVLL